MDKTNSLSKRTFEECYDEIANIVERKRYDWTLKADLMMDFDDVKFIIIAHVWKKWELYDQNKSLGAWVTTVTKHQFANILRDAYLSTTPPCSRCPLNMGEGVCSRFGTVGSEESPQLNCPLYARWYKTKRHSHNVRLPLPLENHVHEISNPYDSSVDIEAGVPRMHAAMKKVLRSSEWEIYRRLYVEHKSEEETAAELDLTSNDKAHKVKNKRIRQVKAIIIAKAKEILKEGLNAIDQ